MLKNLRLLTLILAFGLACDLANSPATANNLAPSDSLLSRGHKAFENGKLRKAVSLYRQARKHFDSKHKLQKNAEASSLALKTLLYTPTRDSSMKAVYESLKQKLPRIKRKFPSKYKRLKVLALNIEMVNQEKLKPVLEDFKKFENNYSLSPDKNPIAWSSRSGLKAKLLLQRVKASKAIKAFQKAKRAYDYSSNPTWLMQALQVDHTSYKVLSYQYMGKMDSAMHFAKKGQKMVTRYFYESHPIKARLLFYEGKIHRKQNEPVKANQAFNKALDIIKRHKLTRSHLRPQLYRKKGNLFANNFQRSKAITYLKQSLHLNQKLFPSDKSKLVYPKMALGNVYKNQHRLKKALITMQEAIKIAQSLPASLKRKRFLINLNINLSNIYREKGNYELCIEKLNKALAIAKSYYPNQSPTIGDIFVNIANLRMKQDKLSLAIKNLNNAKSVYTSKPVSSPQRIGRYVYTNKAFIASKKGNFDAAAKYMQKTYESYTQYYNPNQRWSTPPLRSVTNLTYAFQSSTYQGKALWESYKQTQNNRFLTRALKVYQFSDSLVESLQKRQYLAGNQSALAKNAALVYPYTVAACYRLINSHNTDKPAKFYRKTAFHFGEKGKTLQLLESLSKIRNSLSNQLPDSLNENLQSLSKQINELQRQQALNRKENVERRLTDLKARKAQLLETLKEKHPEFYSISFHDQVVQLHTLQKQLKEQQKELITYTLRDSLFYGVLVSGQKVKIKKLGRGRQLVDSLKTYRNQLAQSKKYNQSLSRYLYKRIFKPFEYELTKKEVVIIPDGPISHLAFSTLAREPDPEKAPDYLIRDYTFSYSPSASLWVQDEEEKKPKASLAQANTAGFIGFAPSFEKRERGNELLAGRTSGKTMRSIPGAQNEVSFGSKVLEGKAVTGNRATENAFKNQAIDNRIIHLATHGVISDQSPAYSSLIMQESKKGSEDGNLYTHELYNLELKADLAVLSACNTGYGPVKRGLGHMSMARGFKLAGCNNVVMTLWQIQDRISTDLVRRFYRHLDNGKKTANALRQAKLEYLKNHDQTNSNPYFWGGFVLMGSNHPIQIEQSQSKADGLWVWLVLGGVGLALILGIGYGWYYRNSKA